MARWVRSKQLMQVFKTATQPTVANGLTIGDIWVNTTSTAVIEVCTAVSPSVVFTTNTDTGMTGAGSSTTNNVIVFADTSGNVASDSGIAISSLAPLASPTFTGSATTSSGSTFLLDKGTGTEASNAVTISAQTGVITTSSLSVAGGANYAITLTNTKIAGSSSIIIASIAGGSNTNLNISLKAVCSGSHTAILTLYNNAAVTTISGTVIINFVVVG